MIKVLLNNSRVITFELGDEKKELELVMRFHNGLDGNVVLNLKTGNKEIATRLRVSDIKNMQYLKGEMNKAADARINGPFESVQDSRFKTREEYEKWKEQKMRENKFRSSRERGQRDDAT